MTFLIDAHLPRRLARPLAASGHDALHTLDLPAGNRTPDSQVIEVAGRHGRIVVTKDDDFVTSRVLHGRPRRLVLVSVGNTSNDDLDRHLFSHLESIVGPEYIFSGEESRPHSWRKAQIAKFLANTHMEPTLPPPCAAIRHGAPRLECQG